MKRTPRPAPDKPTERIYLPPPLPSRPDAGHKGLFGRVLVVGGHEEMFGAAVLAGTAALRCGSGLVQIAVPGLALGHAISITPELIGLALHDRFTSDAKSHLKRSAESADVIVVGPGMGQSAASLQRMKFLCALGKSCVIDADALNNVAASNAKWWTWIKSESLLTPHPGEMSRLSAFLDVDELKVPEDNEGRITRTVLAARTFLQTVLLKGHRTIVTDGRRVYVNRTGDSTLSKAGAGDVLSGVIGSMIGQGMSVFDAACAGAWIHGKAGELAGARIGRRSALARDVIAELNAAIAEYPNKTA